MRRSLLTIAFVLMSMSCFGQVFRFQQFCQTGAQNVITQGLNSTTHVQRSYPSCTVAVYLTGTTTLATIYSDPLSTPLANPFTANTDGSFGFWAAPAATPSGCYDVTISGGNPGDQLGAPFTFADVCLGIGSGGGGGSVACPLAVSGAIGAFTSPTGFSCDPNMGTDFAGNGFSQSWKYLGPVNGFFGVIGGTSDPGTQAKFKLNTNEVRMLAPLTVPTPYYWRIPGTRCTSGQVWQMTGETTDANGDKVDTYGCLTPSSGVSITATSPIVVTPSPITGTGVISCPTCGSVAGTTQLATPNAPTLTVNGTPGTTTIIYEVVASEDPYGVYRTVASGTTSTSTANATLSSSNSVTLSGYGDTLYGARCFDIYRTAAGGSPNTTGKIASCVGKKFTDTGLAGDGTSPPASNNTTLVPHMSALPRANIPPNGIIGVDAPPASPTAFDDEMGQTYGAPADTNNTFWAWCNQQSATAAFSNGAIVITSDTLNQYETLCMALPGSTPFTFTAYVDVHGLTTSDGCGLGMRESSTGKISILELSQNNTAGSAAASGGMIFQTMNGTLAAPTGINFWAYRGGGAYLRAQDTGTNMVFSYSLNGIAYQQLQSQALTTPFTTAPNQIIFGCRAATTASVGVFDYVRRTQ